jgi:hypothetical protein
MEYIEKLQELATYIPRLEQQGLVKTEAGTKQALVLPFIGALGYNVFDPSEVTPELLADPGARKGEQADYAILRDGQPSMVFECKALSVDLSDVQPSILSRYFMTAGARIGVLTNGVVYEFYTDLEAQNRMDASPFLIFSLLDMQLAEMMKLFTKAAFNLETITSIAIHLKYTEIMKKLIAAEMAQPSDAFVRFFAGQIHAGELSPERLAQFAEMIQQVWEDMTKAPESEPESSTFTNIETRPAVKSRTQPELPPAPATFSVLDTKVTPPTMPTPAAVAPPVPEKQASSRNPGLDAFKVIREIVHSVVSTNHVLMRDAQGYCYLVHNNGSRRRIAICRLYADDDQQYVSLFDEHQAEHQFPIENAKTLYQYSEQLKAIVRYYDQVIDVS